MEKLNTYTEKILNENYIQEFFSGDETTFGIAFDCLVDLYPPPEGVDIEDIKEWFLAEVLAFNEENEHENRLPIL